MNTFPKCLIVDDIQENIFALKALLKGANIEIHSAYSASEALELLLIHDYALSLIDVRMPGMDGFELAELMRSAERTKAVPIIFVTAASTDEKRIFQGYEAGAVDFLHKPLSREVVIGKINVFLMLYQQKIELQQKVESLRETEQSLLEALKNRDEFLSICSHELKSPLSALKMHIDINEKDRQLKGDEHAFTVPKMKRFHQMADRSVERIIRLVNDMLDSSRVANCRLALSLDTVDLVILVKDVLERLAPILEMSKNSLQVKLVDSTTIKADRFRIEQVLTNLLINASKYAPSSQVEVEVSHQHGVACLIIRDSGPGIPQEEQNLVFNRFHQVANEHHVKGLGLGLYIAKDIIDNHQGTISLQSLPGKGCTFEVKIPCTCNNC